MTQLESTDGRKAFPCLDEPDLKATFNITLRRKEGVIALSNMPIEYTDPPYVHFFRFIMEQCVTINIRHLLDHVEQYCTMCNNKY